MTENTVKTIKKLANSDEGFTNVKSGATNVLGTLGTINSGSSAEDSGSLLIEVTAVRTLNYLTHWTECLYKVCISIIPKGAQPQHVNCYNVKIWLKIR